MGLKEKVAKLGTIVGVWAHPDDESFMMAGLMAQAARNGQTVACVTATRGEQGVQDEKKWPPSSLGEIRERELQAAFTVLGVKHHHWLGYPDGGCHTIPDEEAIQRVCALLERYQPDTVITFPPDGGTGHFDHISASRWTREATMRLKKPATLYYVADVKEQYERYMRGLDEQFDIYFNLDKPCHIPKADCDLLLELTPELCDTKCDALEAMPSQTSAMFELVGKDKLCKALAIEGYVLAERDIEWGKPKPLTEAAV